MMQGLTSGRSQAATAATDPLRLFISQACLAASLNFDLNAEARTARAKQSSPIIPPV
jgi:hypothetical protein